MADLSITMQHAVDYARKHGGQLERFPGGYWCEPGRTQWTTGIHSTTFGTRTIEALVARGVAQYVEWKDGRGGRFPVKVVLLASHSGVAPARGGQPE